MLQDARYASGKELLSMFGDVHEPIVGTGQPAQGCTKLRRDSTRKLQERSGLRRWIVLFGEMGTAVARSKAGLRLLSSRTTVVQGASA